MSSFRISKNVTRILSYLLEVLQAHCDCFIPIYSGGRIYQYNEDDATISILIYIKVLNSIDTQVTHLWYLLRSRES